jgi:hypothetical protein
MQQKPNMMQHKPNMMQHKPNIIQRKHNTMQQNAWQHRHNIVLPICFKETSANKFYPLLLQ